MSTILTIAGGMPHTGSGFVSGKERVTTAAHVVNTQVRPSVFEREDGPFWVGTIIHLDNERDVAVLRVPGLPFKPFRMAKRLAKPGDVCTISSQWGSQRATILGISGDMYIIKSDEEVRFGTSGGALIAPDGSVIGTVSARANNDPTIGIVAILSK